jgi:hypothetical protein
VTVQVVTQVEPLGAGVWRTIGRSGAGWHGDNPRARLVWVAAGT